METNYEGNDFDGRYGRVTPSGHSARAASFLLGRLSAATQQADNSDDGTPYQGSGDVRPPAQ